MASTAPAYLSSSLGSGSGLGLGLRQRGAGGSEWLWPPSDGDPGALFHVTSAAAGGGESRGGSGGGCLGLVVGSGSSSCTTVDLVKGCKLGSGTTGNMFCSVLVWPFWAAGDRLGALGWPLVIIRMVGWGVHLVKV